jgi:hypothetical protein
MVRGHDASDVAMMTSFGAYELIEFRVWTHELPDEDDNNVLLEGLSTRPHPQQRGLGGQVVTSAYIARA